MPTSDGKPTLEERVAKIEAHGSPQVHKLFRRQLYAFVLIVGVVALGFWALQRASNENAQARNALCAQKLNLQEQIKTTQEFLADPSAFPAFSDPKTLQLIQRGVQRDLATVRTLDDNLSCGTADPDIAPIDTSAK